MVSAREMPAVPTLRLLLSQLLSAGIAAQAGIPHADLTATPGHSKRQGKWVMVWELRLGDIMASASPVFSAEGSPLGTELHLSPYHCRVGPEQRLQKRPRLFLLVLVEIV